MKLQICEDEFDESIKDTHSQIDPVFIDDNRSDCTSIRDVEEKKMLEEILCPMHRSNSDITVDSVDSSFLPTRETEVLKRGYDCINSQPSHYFDCSSSSSSNTGNFVQNQQYDSGNPIVDNELQVANEGSTHNDT